jgi:protein gp37
MVFVNSMSDLFHKDIPDEFIGRVFGTMESVARHTYQVLTKRSSLMRDFVRARYGGTLAPPHIWLGVSAEDGERKSRTRHLKETPASVRFLSVEPLIAPIGKLDLSGIHWVIVGGESGPGFRPMKPEWAREVRDQCVAQGVPFFSSNGAALDRSQAGGRSMGASGASTQPSQWLPSPLQTTIRKALPKCQRSSNALPTPFQPPTNRVCVRFPHTPLWRW